MSAQATQYPVQAEPTASKWAKFYDPHVPTHIDYPHIPLYRLLDDTAARFPNHPCTVFYGKTLSYRQIRAASDSFAAGIRSLGIRKGARVGLLLPNSPQFIIAYYGLLKAGVVVVPLNPLYTEHELTLHLNDCDMEALITLPMFLDKVTSLRDKTPLKHIIVSRIADYLPFPLNLVQGFKENKLIKAHGNIELVRFQNLLKPVSRFVAEPVDPDFLAVMIYSGGTTGTAKGIMLSHFNCIANAHQIVAWAGVDEKDSVLGVMPFFHGAGMSSIMNAALLCGAKIILMPRFNALDCVKLIQKHRPTILVGVPTMFVAFNNLHNIHKYDLSSLKGIFVGAAPLTRAIKETFEAKTGGVMIEIYGLTESVTGLIGNPYHGMQKVGSVGIPFPDVEFKIVDLDNGSDLEPGQLGEIVLRTPTMMLGYYNKPEETQKTIIDGWLHTGDIGYMDEDGYLYITDRKKELIIVGGFNVFPREIDELIYAHPKVKEGITVGIPDDYKGERIKVFIVLRDGETATPQEFIAYFRERLVPYKVPSQVEFRTELPKNAIGKILRRALREEVMHK